MISTKGFLASALDKCSKSEYRSTVDGDNVFNSSGVLYLFTGDGFLGRHDEKGNE
jgi:hypothetical protein